MAGSLSDYLELALLDHVFGGGNYTRPATLYIALFTVAPTDSGPGTEINTGVWTNYARPAVTNNSTNFPAASGTSPGAKTNGTAISFGTASITGTPPVVVGAAVMDASSAGNMLAWCSFTGQTINPGAPVSIQPGDLDITLD